MSKAGFHSFCKLGGSLGDTFSFLAVLSNGLKSLLSAPQSCLGALSLADKIIACCSALLSQGLPARW